MKNIFFASALALVSLPTISIAQDTGQDANARGTATMPTTTQTQSNQPMVDYGAGGGYNHGPSTGHDYSGPAYQPFSVDVFAQANRGGISAAGAVGEHVEYGSLSEGSTQVDIGGSFDNCAGTDCAQRRVFGTVTGQQRDQGYSFATGQQSGSATVAESIGVSGLTVTYGAGFNGQCVGPCQANTSQGQPSSGTSGH